MRGVVVVGIWVSVAVLAFVEVWVGGVVWVGEGVAVGGLVGVIEGVLLGSRGLSNAGGNGDGSTCCKVFTLVGMRLTSFCSNAGRPDPTNTYQIRMRSNKAIKSPITSLKFIC